MPASDAPPLSALFLSDVTRDIPPVVYFHEQAPEKLAAEVEEYIVTGGWQPDHPNHARVPDGIHEQYVRLISGITEAMASPGGPDLPTAWISGFYGSGKSSFAKLFGLALDGVALPGGRSLAEAWLERDTSPLRHELRDAWKALRQKVDPIAVVFDIGGVARDHEHVHAVAVRQVQRRLGYSRADALVADAELALERDGEWARFEATAREVLGRPWDEVKDRAMAEEEFSQVMAALFPARYTDPMAWYTSRAGTAARASSPEEAVQAIGDMLRFRRPGATLFMVVDEVSQYVLGNKDRVDRLRAFATALGAGLKGRAWLLALGQQKLDEQADDGLSVWAKDRFPPRLRVHLAVTNIRDVVHRRLLQKRPEHEARLRALFEAHRADLKLFAYGSEDATSDDFVEVYPLLPGQIDLIMLITTQLRVRSRRAQGDDQAIRGLLQLLGELFRGQKLAERPLGTLVTLDQVYEVQHTALDSDTQASMARVLGQCSGGPNGLQARAAKAVALLELIAEHAPTDARLVAQCLYDRVDRGDQVAAVTEALEDMRRRNMLGFSEKLGYKVQSSAGEDWERERRELPAPREQVAEIVQEQLKILLADPDRPRMQGRDFPWVGLFSDGRRMQDVTFADSVEDGVLEVDFRLLSNPEERLEADWLRRSDEAALRDRLVWLPGDTIKLEEDARDLLRSRLMVSQYRARRESLPEPKKQMLNHEESRADDLVGVVRQAVATTWMHGKLYFRGRAYAPLDLGPVFGAALQQAATRILPELFPHFVATVVAPGELAQLLAQDLSGLSPKLLEGELGIVSLDQGRYLPTGEGMVPRRIHEFIVGEQGVNGTTLLANFGRPPFGYHPTVVRACVAGLLRGGKLRIQTEAGVEVTAVRDVGAKDLFDRDRGLRRAMIYPLADGEGIGMQTRAKVCQFFEQQLDQRLEREDVQIADAMLNRFPPLLSQLRTVFSRLNKVPGPPAAPAALVKLEAALEPCIRECRKTAPAVKAAAKHLDALRDGVQTLRAYDAELTEAAIAAVRAAADVASYHVAQLEALEALAGEPAAAAEQLKAHLATPRPWQDVAALEPALALLRAAYVARRSELLATQEQRVEVVRGRVRSREGFATLTADETRQVLRPLTAAVAATSAEAVAPTLASLRDGFEGTLKRAEAEANHYLDQILADREKILVVEVDLGLAQRELTSEAEVDALLAEVRGRLVPQLGPKRRLRLL